MNPTEQELITHIMSGGLIDSSELDEPVSLQGFYNDDIELTIQFSELQDYHIYLSEKDIQIQSLQKEILKLTELLRTNTKQKKKLGADLREINGSGPAMKIKSPYRAHLTQKEVKEIEEIFKRDFTTKGKVVMNAYGTSTSVTSKIRLGIHGKSSQVYRNHLSSIGQLKD